MLSESTIGESNHGPHPNQKEERTKIYFKDLEIGEAFRMSEHESLYIKVNANDFKHTLSNRLGEMISTSDWRIYACGENEPVRPVNADLVEN